MSTEAIKEPRKSTITVHVKRSLNTAQYENLEIALSSTDEISWSTLDERAKKVDKLVTLLNQRYDATQKSVLNDLGITPKRAWFKEPTNTRVVQGVACKVGDELLD